MSGIVLSASVRQNLLSLQSTASLLATTQNDLSTGNKVNTALDNPTNYFTAQSLNNRAGDINNLLDGIGNGVQVLQAANTGLTSLQSLIASAQSIATQALQSTVGYSTRSNVSTTIAGATPAGLRGTTSFTNADALQQRAVQQRRSRRRHRCCLHRRTDRRRRRFDGVQRAVEQQHHPGCDLERYRARQHHRRGLARSNASRRDRPCRDTSSPSTARPSPSRRATSRPRPRPA